jgi:hypothetical protein
MGLYEIHCPKCDKPFKWFSGNDNQLCVECDPPNREYEKVKMKKADAWKLLLDGKPICHESWKYLPDSPDRHIFLDDVFIYEWRYGKKDKTGYNYYHEADGWELYGV